MTVSTTFCSHLLTGKVKHYSTDLLLMNPRFHFWIWPHWLAILLSFLDAINRLYYDLVVFNLVNWLWYARVNWPRQDVGWKLHLTLFFGNDVCDVIGVYVPDFTWLQPLFLILILKLLLLPLVLLRVLIIRVRVCSAAISGRCGATTGLCSHLNKN